MVRAMSIVRRRSAPVLLGVSACLAFASACGPTLSEDFDSFCRVVNEVNKDNSLGTEEKLAKIAGRSAEYMKSAESMAADNVWQKLNNAPPDKKYASLVDSARSAGKADYKCGGYEKMLVMFTVEQAAKQKAAEEKAAAAAAAAAAASAQPDPKAGATADAGKATKKGKKKKKKRSRN